MLLRQTPLPIGLTGLVQVERIELSSSAWKADIIIHYTKLAYGRCRQIRTATLRGLSSSSLPVGVCTHGESGEIRTHTEAILSRVPLPVGIRSLVGANRVELMSSAYRTDALTVVLSPNMVAGSGVAPDIRRL